MEIHGCLLCTRDCREKQTSWRWSLCARSLLFSPLLFSIATHPLVVSYRLATHSVVQTPPTYTSLVRLFLKENQNLGPHPTSTQPQVRTLNFEEHCFSPANSPKPTVPITFSLLGLPSATDLIANINNSVDIKAFGKALCL